MHALLSIVAVVGVGSIVAALMAPLGPNTDPGLNEALRSVARAGTSSLGAPAIPAPGMG